MKLLFGAPDLFGMNDMLIENLKQKGFEVNNISISEKLPKLGLVHKILLFINSKILKKQRYKKKIYNQYKAQEIRNIFKIALQQQYDFCLLIRPDIYPISILKQIKQNSKKTVAFQWDGIHRFPAVFETINLFDKFYVFDKNDFDEFKNQYANLHFIDNFYSDVEPNELKSIHNKTQDVYYLGSYHKKRILDVYELCRQLENVGVKNFNVNINIRGKKIKSENYNVNFTSTVVNYLENLKHVKEAKIILDFKLANHNGLSFRFFEALKYKSKIITNNQSVKQYDFYNSDNILVIGEFDDFELKQFIESPYKELPLEIVEKYSFSNWINTLFAS